MKWFSFAVQFLCIFSLSFTQDVSKLKMDQIGELVKIVRSLDTKIQEIKTEMTSKFQALEDKVTAIDSRMTANEDKTSNLDLLYQSFAEIFEEERELVRNLSSETCSKSQLNILQELLATDECEEGSGFNNCSSDAQCTDAPLGYKCTCLSGYEGNGITCQDVDECGSGVHNCSINGHCLNQLGNYSCTCRQGFSGDGVICEDVDECSTGTHFCSIHASCSNTEGNYSCSCLSGFTGDGFTNCQDIDECSADVSPCHSNADCINNEGNVSCICKSGSSCIDIDLDSCVSPFKEIGDVRCVVPIKDQKRTWEEARQHCKTLGGRLLEGIASQSHLDLLKKHFGDLFDGNYVWVGIINFNWLESGGIALSRHSPLWWIGEPQGGSTNCVGICVSCTRPAFGDSYCTNTRYSLCQME